MLKQDEILARFREARDREFGVKFPESPKARRAAGDQLSSAQAVNVAEDILRNCLRTFYRLHSKSVMRGELVQTPSGPGRLWCVFDFGVFVVLDSHPYKVAFFESNEVMASNGGLP